MGWKGVRNRLAHVTIAQSRSEDLHDLDNELYGTIRMNTNEYIGF